MKRFFKEMIVAIIFITIFSSFYLLIFLHNGKNEVKRNNKINNFNSTTNIIKTFNTGGSMTDLKGKKVLIIIAPKDFRDEELLIPLKMLEKVGANVTVASLKKGIAEGMLGTKYKVEYTINDVNPDEYDAILFAGGVGATIYFHNSEILDMVRKEYEKGKIIGAICIAPVILANAGILRGKRATVWPSEAKILEDKGAIYTGNEVTVDGRIVTANGPKAAEKYANAIIELLSKENS